MPTIGRGDRFPKKPGCHRRRSAPRAPARRDGASDDRMAYPGKRQPVVSPVGETLTQASCSKMCGAASSMVTTGTV